MDTRQRIVDAADRVMQRDGLARTTTKAIAREAGVSEGSIYNHFESKEHLYLTVISEQISPFVGLMEQLPQRAGQEPLAEVLIEVMSAALEFYAGSYRMSASIFAEPSLLAQQREGMRARGAGPHKAIDLLEAWLATAQRLGSVRPDADVRAAATMLIGAAHQRAFLAAFWDREDSPAERDALARATVNTILHGLLP